MYLITLYQVNSQHTQSMNKANTIHLVQLFLTPKASVFII